jgi:hypothetical protein
MALDEVLVIGYAPGDDAPSDPIAPCDVVSINPGSGTTDHDRRALYRDTELRPHDRNQGDVGHLVISTPVRVGLRRLVA